MTGDEAKRIGKAIRVRGAESAPAPLAARREAARVLGAYYARVGDVSNSPHAALVARDTFDEPEPDSVLIAPDWCTKSA